MLLSISRDEGGRFLVCLRCVRWKGHGRDGDARADALHAIDNDTFTGFQARTDQPLIAHSALGGHRSHFNSVVGADYKYRRLA